MNKIKISKQTFSNYSSKLLKSNWCTSWFSDANLEPTKASETKDNILVGVIDSFNNPSNLLFSNDLLNFSNPYNMHNIEKPEHGIPVSSIILSLNPKLTIHAYPYATYFKTFKEYANYYSKLLVEMIKHRHIKIINLSICFSSLNIVANDCLKELDNEKPKFSAKKAQEILNDINFCIENTLLKLLNEGYDFLLVKCAGNTSNIRIVQANSLNYGFSLSDSVATYEDESFLISKTPRLMSYWDFFSGINNPQIKNRIIVVGSTKQIDDKYILSYFNNYDDRVDVLAPGQDVIALSDTGDFENYSGTSFAASIITGVSSLIWQCYPCLTGDEIKQVIINNSTLPVFDFFNTDFMLSKKMINLKKILNEYY